MPSPSNLLCLNCRKSSHGNSECPRVRPTPSQQDPLAETRMLDELRAKGNILCHRCEQYKILEVFDTPDIADQRDHTLYIYGVNQTANVMTDWHQHRQENNLVLGSFKEIMLDGRCPLCRLIFRIFPPYVEDVNEFPITYPPGHPELEGPGPVKTVKFYLRPFPSYDRQPSFFEEVDPSLKPQYALYFSVESEQTATANLMENFADQNQEMIGRVRECFALSHKNTSSIRKALAPQEMGPTVDFTLHRRWLDRCSKCHGVNCQRTWSDEMLTSRMIDVSIRQVVECPPDCDFAALSYVWGDVVPEDGALENRRLPQTIEDAITVTQQLGKRYLWVDALCVDQTPTPQQAQQLARMDVIYQCASLTIVALSGVASDSGLPGISLKTPRIPQGAESVRGKQLLTIFPMLAQDMTDTKYSTRAWTMQEGLLSKRRIIFANNQVHYLCSSASFSECIDHTYDPANHLEGYHPKMKGLSFFNQDPPASNHLQGELLAIGEEDYRNCLYNYTSRQMTNDRDSLNAFLGIVGYLRKAYFPKGLIWGMPLHDFPQSLRWYHARWVKPRRRPAFPSWSWAGWEGQASYSGPLDLASKPERGRLDLTALMTIRFIDIDDQILTVEAHVVRLEIRTEPFSDAYVPGTEDYLGPIKEGNSLHNNTLPSQIKDFLVVERIRYRAAPDRPFREDIYMLLLDWKKDGYAVRRTKVRLFLGPDGEFEKANPELQKVRLK